MRKYDTIIWDMDGTLLDTLDDLRDSVNAALSKYNLPVRTKKEIRSFVGNGVRNLLVLSVPGGKSHPKFEEIFLFFKSYYEIHCNDKTKPYEGLEKVLPELKRRGYRMAVASNKIDIAVKKLAGIYFKDTIDEAVGEKEGLSRKPSPDLVCKAIELLKSKKESAAYIGDTEVDILTAKNAGIDCISVSWGFRDKSELLAAGAKLIVDTPDELARVLADT